MTHLKSSHYKPSLSACDIAIDRLAFPREKTFDNDELRLKRFFFFFWDPVEVSLVFKDLSEAAFLSSISWSKGVIPIERSRLVSLLFGVLVGTAKLKVLRLRLKMMKRTIL